MTDFLKNNWININEAFPPFNVDILLIFTVYKTKNYDIVVIESYNYILKGQILLRNEFHGACKCRICKTKSPEICFYTDEELWEYSPLFHYLDKQIKCRIPSRKYFIYSMDPYWRNELLKNKENIKANDLRFFGKITYWRHLPEFPDDISNKGIVKK